MIAPALIEHFDYSRADHLRTSQSVIKDIVKQLSSADLVVADLTGQNPNVLYELGLSHALNIPTILLVDNANDLPFNISSYRAIIYGQRHWSYGQRDLIAIIDRFIDGTGEFGSPVSEFLGAQIKLPIRPEPFLSTIQDQISVALTRIEHLSEFTESKVTELILRHAEVISAESQDETYQEYRHKSAAFSNHVDSYIGDSTSKLSDVRTALAPLRKCFITDPTEQLETELSKGDSIQKIESFLSELVGALRHVMVLNGAQKNVWLTSKLSDPILARHYHEKSITRLEDSVTQALDEVSFYYRTNISEFSDTLDSIDQIENPCV